MISKCPRCKSPKPEFHPAVQFGGEVTICPDPFHGKLPDNVWISSHSIDVFRDSGKKTYREIMEDNEKGIVEYPRDAVTERVRSDLLRRQQHGFQKYGNTLETNPATLVEKLKHAYEEALDYAQYLQWAIMDLEGSPELRPDPAGNVGLRSIVRRCQGASARADGSCIACFAAAGHPCLSPAAV